MTYLDRLRALDTGAVSDALDGLGLGGVALGLRSMWPNPKVAGRVRTMKVVAAPGARADRHLGVEAIEAASPGDVIVVQQVAEEGLISAAWGGLLARAAHKQGVTGVVIDGNCRDVDEIHDLGLPIIARGAVPLTARRRYIEQSSGEPVRIGGVEVRQGDFMLADSTGLVFISLKHIDGVLANAERVIAKEALMAKDIADGVAPSTVLDTSYEELLDDEEEGLNAF